MPVPMMDIVQMLVHVPLPVVPVRMHVGLRIGGLRIGWPGIRKLRIVLVPVVLVMDVLVRVLDSLVLVRMPVPVEDEEEGARGHQ